MRRVSRIMLGEIPIGQIARYVVVAASGYLLAVLVYSVELAFGISPYLALGVVFSLNGLFNFALLRAWAFPPSGRSLRSDLSRFCIVASVSFLVNYASFAVLYSAVSMRPATAQRLAIVIAAPVTFFANRLWSFSPHAPRVESPTIVGRARRQGLVRSARGPSRR